MAPWLVLGACNLALAAPGEDPVAWLQRAASSARETTYSGTVVHTVGDHTATSRVTHLFLSGSEHEKIESLDGPRREIVRHNDDMQCFYPDAKTVRMDRRVSARFFPSLLNGSPQSLAEHYKLSLGAVDRVLGKECRWIHLDPRDALRFAQRLCAELSTGLLLRAQTLGARQQVVEQFTFTDLRLGNQVSRGEVKGTFFAQSKDWRRDSQPLEEAKSVATGWNVGTPPAGFRLVGELQRRMPGKPQPVSQLVLSDGIASMSVFVEPLVNARRVAEVINEEGALSIFVRPVGEHLVTVLGEVPGNAVQQVGRSVARQAPAPGAR